jgi:hypothetical protein
VATYNLVCPFLNNDPTFAYGVEFGLLYARMRSGVKRVKGYFCRENQDQILLLANRLGWTVRKLKPWDEGWFWCVLEKTPAPAS